MSGAGEEVGIHGGVGGAVSGDDDVIGEPDGETGGDDGAGCVGEVICIYPYVPLVRPVVFQSFLNMTNIEGWEVLYDKIHRQ